MKYNLIYLTQSILLIAFAPLFSGILKKLKAMLRGYQGPSIVQPYYDIQKLLRKGRVISRHSSFITTISPLLCFSAAVTAAMLIPVFYAGKENYLGNLFLIIFTLGIIKFFNSLLGLDCASTFGGMGSSRELFISMLVEPIIFVLLTFLYFETRSFNLFDIATVNNSLANYSAAHIIAGFAFFILVITENARVPVDNPETHLELTMVHEAMVLDISGSDLALLELASSIKLMVFLTIFINCFLPYGIAASFSAGSILFSIAVYLLKLLICLTLIAYLEIGMAKYRLFRVPDLLAAAFSFSVIAITLNYII